MFAIESHSTECQQRLLEGAMAKTRYYGVEALSQTYGPLRCSVQEVWTLSLCGVPYEIRVPLCRRREASSGVGAVTQILYDLGYPVTHKPELPYGPGHWERVKEITCLDAGFGHWYALDCEVLRVWKEFLDSKVCVTCGKNPISPEYHRTWQSITERNFEREGIFLTGLVRREELVCSQSCWDTLVQTRKDKSERDYQFKRKEDLCLSLSRKALRACQKALKDGNLSVLKSHREELTQALNSLDS